MKFMLFLYLLTSTLACGTESTDQIKLLFDNKKTKDPRVMKSIEAIFLKYYKSFNKDCGVRARIPIGLSEEKADYAAVCYIWTNDKNEVTFKEIRVNKFYWSSYDEETKQWLVYHELGHCALNKEHNSDMITPYIPKSIMHPTLPINAKYLLQNDREYYIKELCGTIKKEPL